MPMYSVKCWQCYYSISVSVAVCCYKKKTTKNDIMIQSPGLITSDKPFDHKVFVFKLC